uniref:Mos1 transposase HTH domain-containing protein n=1 Tax=Acrobeloides nanus TaxID=290746 RepID=A0A914DG54_9BILA
MMSEKELPLILRHCIWYEFKLGHNYFDAYQNLCNVFGPNMLNEKEFQNLYWEISNEPEHKIPSLVKGSDRFRDFLILNDNDIPSTSGLKASIPKEHWKSIRVEELKPSGKMLFSEFYYF